MSECNYSCDVSQCQAKCCAAILPISQEEHNKIVDYIKEHKTKPTDWNSTQNIFKREFTNKCPFLGADCRCKIYEARPEICRKYHCGSHMTDFQFDGKKIVNFYSEFFPEIMKGRYVPDLSGLNKIFEGEKKRRKKR